jgi:hypothetical protein
VPAFASSAPASQKCKKLLACRIAQRNDRAIQHVGRNGKDVLRWLFSRLVKINHLNGNPLDMTNEFGNLESLVAIPAMVSNINLKGETLVVRRVFLAQLSPSLLLKETGQPERRTRTRKKRVIPSKSKETTPRKGRKGLKIVIAPPRPKSRTISLLQTGQPIERNERTEPARVRHPPDEDGLCAADGEVVGYSIIKARSGPRNNAEHIHMR